jgi:hypothetical protein
MFCCVWHRGRHGKGFWPSQTFSSHRKPSERAESRPPTPAHKNVRARPFSAPPVRRGEGGDGNANVHLARQTHTNTHHGRRVEVFWACLILKAYRKVMSVEIASSCASVVVVVRRRLAATNRFDRLSRGNRPGSRRLCFFRIFALLVCTLNHLTWTRTKSALFNIHLFIIRRALSIITRSSGQRDGEAKRRRR